MRGSPRSSGKQPPEYSIRAAVAIISADDMLGEIYANCGNCDFFKSIRSSRVAITARKKRRETGLGRV
jgi:hypothetical protein